MQEQKIQGSLSELSCATSNRRTSPAVLQAELRVRTLLFLLEGNPRSLVSNKIHHMTLIDIVLVLVVAGLILWLINTYVPMAGGIKSLLNVVVFVVLLIWVLQVFGLIGAIPFRVPPLR
jgi:uncharacterized membrane-anchored protein